MCRLELCRPEVLVRVPEVLVCARSRVFLKLSYTASPRRSDLRKVGTLITSRVAAAVGSATAIRSVGFQFGGRVAELLPFSTACRAGPAATARANYNRWRDTTRGSCGLFPSDTTSLPLLAGHAFRLDRASGRPGRRTTRTLPRLWRTSSPHAHETPARYARSSYPARNGHLVVALGVSQGTCTVLRLDLRSPHPHPVGSLDSVLPRIWPCHASSPRAPAGGRAVA